MYDKETRTYSIWFLRDSVALKNHDRHRNISEGVTNLLEINEKKVVI